MPHQQTPRQLPNRSRRRDFAPRRSYARARASREKVEAVDRILRNQRSQARFARNLKITVNIICLLGIIGLVVWTFVALREDKADPRAPMVTPDDFRRY